MACTFQATEDGKTHLCFQRMIKFIIHNLIFIENLNEKPNINISSLFLQAVSLS